VVRSAEPGPTAERLFESIKAKAPKAELFLNPGSESDELVERAESLGLETIQACSIIDIGERP